MPLEIAVNPTSLTIRANARILEGQSTQDFEESPNIPLPQQYGGTNRIIQNDQPFKVRFNWRTAGPFVGFLSGGKWKCDVLFESMGGSESAFNPSNIKSDAGVNGANYQLDINVPAFSLPVGLYRVVARMQWYFANGKPGPLVAFDDLGMIQIYNEDM